MKESYFHSKSFVNDLYIEAKQIQFTNKLDFVSL